MDDKVSETPITNREVYKVIEQLQARVRLSTGKKTLNFYPYYEPYLTAHTKTTTFRLNVPPLTEGDRVMLTLGWNETDVTPLHEAIIRTIYKKRCAELIEEDFRGESPDCQAPEVARLVLAAIYKRVVLPEDFVWIVKFEHASRV